MGFTRPTVADFKSQFDRDFPFAVPAWGASGRVTTLAGGAIVALTLDAGGEGYTSAPDVTVEDETGTGAEVTATVEQGEVTELTLATGGTGYTAPTLKFSGGAGSETDRTRVRDRDIEGGFLDASYNVNEALFGTQEQYTRAFCFLAAHCMCERLLAAGEGLRSRYSWLVNSRTVGDLSESFTIPKSILESPFLSAISKTRYGAMYLQIISPLLIGNMLATYRQSLP